MGDTGQHHNAAMIRQLINQTCNQNEVSNMIGQKLKFQVEFLLQFRQCHDSGIGDNAIEPVITRPDLINCTIDATWIRQFTGQWNGVPRHLCADLTSVLKRSRQRNHAGAS